jgi:hypothetical protein
VEDQDTPLNSDHSLAAAGICEGSTVHCLVDLGIDERGALRQILEQNAATLTENTKGEEGTADSADTQFIEPFNSWCGDDLHGWEGVVLSDNASESVAKLSMPTFLTGLRY